jgi:hypothetical protein
VALQAACRALGFNAAFVYRDRARRRGVFTRHPISARARPPLILSTAEQERLVGVLDSERFADTAPATIYATLLDEGHYYGSVRTALRSHAFHHSLRRLVHAVINAKRVKCGREIGNVDYMLAHPRRNAPLVK